MYGFEPLQWAQAMTDEQLARYLNVTLSELAKLTAGERVAYERLALTELGVKLWLAGKAERPDGVIICDARRRRGTV